MKQYLIFIMAFVLVACEKDAKWGHEDYDTSETIVTLRHGAYIALEWTENCRDLVREVVVEYSLNQTFDTVQSKLMNFNGSVWETAISNLEESQTYYMRYVVSPVYLTPKQSTSSFVTENHSTPNVITYPATNITATSAQLYGSVTLSYDNYEITERGFYYSLAPESDFERKQFLCGSGEGYFNLAINTLRANATYYFWAYAVNINGITYGDTLTFNTLNPYE